MRGRNSLDTRVGKGLYREARPGWQILLEAALVAAFAFLLALIAWSRAGGPITGGDTGRYLELSRLLAAGSLSGFEQWPMVQFYPLLLTPIFIFDIAQAVYLKWLHIGLHAATVGLVYFSARGLLPSGRGIYSAFAAAVFPTFLFWLPYTLTETAFLFTLSLYLFQLSRLLARPGKIGFVLLVFLGVIMLFTRPTSVAVLAATPFVYLLYAVARTYDLGRALALSAGLGLACGLIGVWMVFFTDNSLSRRAQVNPTIAHSLWVGIKVKSTSMAELNRMTDEYWGLYKRFGADKAGLRHYQISEAKSFIRANPLRYASMAGTRFISYWFPWAFNETWSWKHVLVDAIVSLALVSGFLLALFLSGGQRLPASAMLLLALALSMFSAFGQVDADARYRVPAALVLLLVAPEGWRLAIGRIAGSRRRIA